MVSTQQRSPTENGLNAITNREYFHPNSWPGTGELEERELARISNETSVPQTPMQ